MSTFNVEKTSSLSSIDPPTTGNDTITLSIGQMKDGKFAAVSHDEGKNIIFVGVSEGNSVIHRMLGENDEEMVKLLTRAVNNRTRQRNYFRLYNQMLLNEISEEDFYKTIEENEDDYIVEELDSPSKEQLFLALRLSRNIKDVNNSEDLADLFSFNSVTTDQQLKVFEDYGCIQ